MKVRTIDYANVSDSNIYKQLANLSKSNYQKGLSVLNQEINPSSSPTPLITNPTNATIKIGSNRPESSQIISKSYSISNLNVPKSSTSISPITTSTLDEFIKTSSYLENELNDILTTLKINNTSEYYGGALTDNEANEQLDNILKQIEQLDNLPSKTAKQEKEYNDLVDKFLLEYDNLITKQGLNPTPNNSSVHTALVNYKSSGSSSSSTPSLTSQAVNDNFRKHIALINKYIQDEDILQVEEQMKKFSENYEHNRNASQPVSLDNDITDFYHAIQRYDKVLISLDSCVHTVKQLKSDKKKESDPNKIALLTSRINQERQFYVDAYEKYIKNPNALKLHSDYAKKYNDYVKALNSASANQPVINPPIQQTPPPIQQTPQQLWENDFDNLEQHIIDELSKLNPPFNAVFTLTFSKDYKVSTLEEMEKYLYVIGDVVSMQHLDAFSFIREYKSFDKLDEPAKQAVNIVFHSDLYSNEELFNAMYKNKIKVFRNHSQNDISLTKLPTDKKFRKELWKMFIGDSSVRTDVDITKASARDIQGKLKSIQNTVDSLNILCNILVKNRFSGANYKSIEDIRNQYDELGDKVHILTSMNKSNSQLVKLDKEFNKLYTNVMYGVNSFVPPTTGGSLLPTKKLNTFIHIPNNNVQTDKLYFL